MAEDVKKIQNEGKKIPEAGWVEDWVEAWQAMARRLVRAVASIRISSSLRQVSGIEATADSSAQQTFT